MDDGGSFFNKTSHPTWLTAEETASQETAAQLAGTEESSLSSYSPLILLCKGSLHIL